MSDCYECTSGFASALVQGVRERICAGQLQKKKFVWLELTGCSGNIISLLDGNNPDFKYLASEMVQFVYDNSLIVKQGSKAMDQLFSVIGAEFILAVEGAITTKDNGIYNIIGMCQGQHVTAYDAIKRLGEAATQVIAVGACASDGGVSAASPILQIVLVYNLFLIKRLLNCLDARATRTGFLERLHTFCCLENQSWMPPAAQPCSMERHYIKGAPGGWLTPLYLLYRHETHAQRFCQKQRVYVLYLCMPI